MTNYSFIMESGAKGCEVVVSGKLRGQRAKAMKFVDGLMIHSGDPVNEYVDMACRHVLLRQGVLGIKVGEDMSIMSLLKSIIVTRIVMVTVKAEVDKMFLGVVNVGIVMFTSIKIQTLFQCLEDLD